LIDVGERSIYQQDIGDKLLVRYGADCTFGKLTNAVPMSGLGKLRKPVEAWP
jgi:hypothetical protein